MSFCRHHLAHNAPQPTPANQNTQRRSRKRSGRRRSFSKSTQRWRCQRPPSRVLRRAARMCARGGSTLIMSPVLALAFADFGFRQAAGCRGAKTWRAALETLRIAAFFANGGGFSIKTRRKMGRSKPNTRLPLPAALPKIVDRRVREDRRKCGTHDSKRTNRSSGE